jgi:putative ABC transport system ATP-binding protein
MSTQAITERSPSVIATPPPLELLDVSKVYGDAQLAVQALRGVTLTVHEGEFVAVMGPSGSGKSTLLQLAGGVESPSAGCVSICGRALVGQSSAARAQARLDAVGYVFQALNLVSSLTAKENVALPLELAGEKTKRAYRLATEALIEVGLESSVDKFPEEMSGGQQQRVAIARGLIGDRKLILADEPTGALDSVSGEAVLRLLRAKVDAGAAAILVTHDARHAAWADRTVFLRDGLIIDDTGGPGDPRDLLGPL